MAKSRAPRRPFWLIANQEDGHLEVYTLYPGGGRQVLPIFSFEREAEVFLRLEAPGTGWWARETTAGELISVLYGPCASAKEVALDPLPVVGGEVIFDLLGPAREDFLRDFVGAAPAPEHRLRPKVTMNNALPESADGKGTTPSRETEEVHAWTENGTARRELEGVRVGPPNGDGHGYIPDHVMRDFGSPE